MGDYFQQWNPWCLNAEASLAAQIVMHSDAYVCLSLCHPTDCSLPGSFVYGISQARILERVVYPFYRGSS